MAQPITFDLSSLCSPSTVNQTTTTQVQRPMPKRCECVGCNKKLMLSDLKCKCEKYFCQGHRFATDHICPYDYKGESKQ